MNEDQLIIKRRGEDGYRVFSVRIPENLIAKIDSIASESGRSRNEVIGILLEYSVERCRIE